jgi:hypothetical protein
MSKARSSIKLFLLGLLLALCVCFGVQALFYFGFDSGTGKTESNYFSTMSRFQSASTSAAEIAFAGSSITGRLPGREAGNERIANLGSDGGNALDGMRSLAQGKIPTPQWLVIELNTLVGEVGIGDSLVSRGVQGPWFEVSARMPLLGASSRPSSMLYAQLLNRQKVLTGEPLEVTIDDLTAVDGKTEEDFSERERRRIKDIVDAIEHLQQQGVKILLVNYPEEVVRDSNKIHKEATLGVLRKRLNVIYLDLGKQIPRNALQFTDSVHLGPESAARVLATITKTIRALN